MKIDTALLAALSDTKWQNVGHHLGPFTPGQARFLVCEGLAEQRVRPRKSGAHEYRRTKAGREFLEHMERGGRISAANPSPAPNMGLNHAGARSGRSQVKASGERGEGRSKRHPGR